MADDYVSYVRDRNTGVVKEIHDEGARTALATKYELGVGETIPSGADLNNYTTPGVYIIPTDYSVGNDPSSISVTKTMVVSANASSAAPVQRITDLNSGVTHYRVFESWNSKWGNWYLSDGLDGIVAVSATAHYWAIKYESGRAYFHTSVAIPHANFQYLGYDALRQYQFEQYISLPFDFAYKEVQVSSRDWTCLGLVYSETNNESESRIMVQGYSTQNTYDAVIDVTVNGIWK